MFSFTSLIIWLHCLLLAGLILLTDMVSRCWGLLSQNGMKEELFAINCLQQRSLLRCMLSDWQSLPLIWALMAG
uniref:Uncharacterized protein n=1 Tax=Salix viminalis TaxID=40686 RepID=A0A6N2NIP2_SALVM